MTGDYHYDQREALYAATHSHAEHPAGQHSHGALIAHRVQPLLDTNGGALDTLVKLIERGPQATGDIPSKAGLNELLAWGLAVQIVGADGDYCFAATPDGRDAYCYRHGADTLGEAKERRRQGATRLGMGAHAVKVGEAVIGTVFAPLGSDGKCVRIEIPGYQGGSLLGTLVAFKPDAAT